MEGNYSGGDSSFHDAHELDRRRLFEAALLAAGGESSLHARENLAAELNRQQNSMAVLAASGRTTPPRPSGGARLTGRLPQQLEGRVLAPIGGTPLTAVEVIRRRHMKSEGLSANEGGAVHPYDSAKELRRQREETAILAAVRRPAPSSLPAEEEIRKLQHQAGVFAAVSRNASQLSPIGDQHQRLGTAVGTNMENVARGPSIPGTAAAQRQRQQQYGHGGFLSTTGGRTPPHLRSLEEEVRLQQYENSLHTVQAAQTAQNPDSRVSSALASNQPDTSFVLDAFKSSSTKTSVPMQTAPTSPWPEGTEMMDSRSTARSDSAPSCPAALLPPRPQAAKASQSPSSQGEERRAPIREQLPRLFQSKTPPRSLSPKASNSPRRSKSPTRSTSPGPMKKRPVPPTAPFRETEISQKRPRLETSFLPVNDIMSTNEGSYEKSQSSKSSSSPIEEKQKPTQESPMFLSDSRPKSPLSPHPPANSQQQPETKDNPHLPGRGVPSPVFGVSSRYPLQLYDLTFPASLAYCRNPFRTSTRNLRHGTQKPPTDLGIGSARAKAAPNLSGDVSSSALDVGDGTVFDDPEVVEIVQPELVQSEVKPEVKPDSKSEVKPEVRAEVKPEVVKSEKSAPKKGKSKKKKIEYVHERLPLSQQDFTSPKDRLFAKKALSGLVDLSGVLNDRDAEWLGKNLWIFTVQQLKHVLKNESQAEFTALERIVAMSSLVQGNEDVEEVGYVVESQPLVERGSDGTPKPPVSANGPYKVTGVAKPSRKKEGRATNDETESLAIPSEQAEAMGNDDEKARLEAPAEKIGSVANREIPRSETDDDNDFNKGKEKTIAPSGKNLPILGADTRSEPSAQSNSKSDEDNQNLRSIGGEEQAGDENTTMDEQDPSSPDHSDGQMKRHCKNDEPSLEQQREANQKLWQWRDLIQSVDARTASKAKGQFSFKGPLRCLLPIPVRNFLETVKVRNLRDFFSLKKTEAAPLTSVYKDWRRHCDLPTMKGYCLARHFLGLTQRMEKAVTSVPPVDEYTRVWMGQVFCILTGGSKDFIIGECKVEDVDVFLGERTKEWSDKLVAWRERSSLPPLKGSGKVAMVSGWKTSLKEALDVERGVGRVLSEKELIMAPPLDPNAELVEPVQKKKVVRKAPKALKDKPAPQSYESGESALRSSDFLASCLRSENVRFLASVGISTAQDLIEADKRPDSPVVRELIRFRTEVTSVPSQAATCVRLMYDWTQRVKSKLEEIQSDSVKSLAKKRGPRPKDDSDLSEDVRAPKGAKSPKMTVLRHKSAAAVMETLSNTTRTFLDTMGITDAEELLKTKTSLISKSYIQWREEQGMQPLKGYGAIATVSGWKAQIRKSAADAGLYEINSIVPEDPKRLSGGSVSSNSHNRAAHPQIEPKIVVTYTPDPNLLFGLPHRRFKVQSTTDPSLAFVFELTVRRREDSAMKHSTSVFLTFLGRRKIAPAVFSDGLESLQADSAGDLLPVLLDVSDSTDSDKMIEGISTYSTLDDGCGLIDVGFYGVRELRPQDHLEPLKEMIRMFLVEQDDEILKKMKDRVRVSDISAPSGERQNVFQTVDVLGTRSYLFNQIEPMEEGQVVPLHFACEPIFESPKSNETRHTSGVLARFVIGKMLLSLSTKDLRDLLDWISNDCSDFLKANGISDTRKGQKPSSREATSSSTNDASQMAVDVACHSEKTTAPSIASEENSSGGAIGMEVESTESGDAPMSEGQDSKSEDAPSVLSMTASAVRQRRLHWLGANMLKQNDRIDRLRNVRVGTKAFDEKIAFRSAVEKLMTNSSFEQIRSSQNPSEHQMYKLLMEEICDEIESSVLTNTGDSIFDTSLFCKMAQELFSKCQNVVSDHIILHKQSSLQKQEQLLRNLCQLAVQYASDIDTDGAADGDRMDFSRTDEGHAVATGTHWQGAVFRQRVDVQSGHAKVNWQWYVQCQILRVVHEVALCDQIAWLMTPDPVYSHISLVAAIRKDFGDRSQARSNNREWVAGLGQCSPRRSSNRFSAVGTDLSASTAPVSLIPNSLPLFLGLVWPRLKGLYGWKLDAGTSVHDVTFLPPGQKNREKRKRDLCAQIKLERLQKRARMENRLQEVGFGYIPKLTKRLVVQSSATSPDQDQEVSAKVVLEAFGKKLKSELGRNASGGVDSITRSFLRCFDLVVKCLDGDTGNAEDSLQSNAGGCEQLLPILMMLPSILQQSGLPYRQMENALGCVKDLVRYITLNCDSLFEKSFVPLKEEYAAEEDMPPEFITTLLKNNGTGSMEKQPKDQEATGENSQGISESLVMPEDLIDLTPFLETTMRQVLYCRSTRADNSKKGRRNIPVGYPGMVCKHCLGSGGEGKYFFSSVESLGTAPGVVYSHLLKCNRFPAAERQKLVAKKGKHPEQRKTLRHGAQAKYFSRVWKRLHSTSASGAASVYIVNREQERSSIAPEGGIAEDLESDGDLIEFKSHLEVLRYIETTPPWKESSDLADCIKSYQHCLSEGARIYGSHSMPLHFSSEWLLAKLSPNRLTLKEQMQLS